MSTRTRVNGRDFDVRRFPSGTTSVTAALATTPPMVFEVHVVEGGHMVVEHDGRRHVAEAVRVGNACWVHVGGRAYLVEVSDARAAARPRAHAHDTLTAPMPATVVRVGVAVGDLVDEGQVLLVLEAMKMQMPLKAPHRAVVRAIACAVGDLVQPQVALIDLDAIDA